MALNPVAAGVTAYSSFSGLADGDGFNIASGGVLDVDASTVDINPIWFNNALRELRLSNSSSTAPNILNMSGNLNGAGGTLRLATGSITLSSPYTVPVDGNSERPSHIGFLKNGTDIYTEVESFTNMHADERGLHFKYNSSTGAITFGDGTNGKAPTGDIEISNQYIETSSTIDIGRLVGSGWLVINGGSFDGGQVIDLDDDSYWAQVNSNSNYSEATTKHRRQHFCFVLTGSNSRSITLGEDTEGDYFIWSKEATANIESVKNQNVAINGTIEARHITQPSSSTHFAPTNLYNNGGTTGHIVNLGGNATALELEGGGSGEFDFSYSTGYKRTENSFYYGAWARNELTNKIKTATRIGSEAWPSQAEHFLRFEAGNIEVGSDDADITLPSDADFDDFLYFSGTSRGKLNRVINNGSSASGTRDYNVFSSNWQISNVKMLSDTSHGNQEADNTEYHFCSMIGQTPKFGRGMNHSEIITNADGDEGSVWMLPYTPTTGNVTFNGGYYYEPNAVTENRSGIISGVGIATAVNINGDTTGNFTVEYKIWQVTESEPASYTSFTLANVQASQSGFTTSTRWYWKTRITKNSSSLQSGRITGIEIQCPFDSSFVWQEPEIYTITAPDVISGSAVQLCNTEDDTILDYQKLTSAGYTVDLFSGAEVGDTLRLRVSYQSGGTHKEPIEVLGVLTASGLQFVVSQEDWTVPNTWGTDGSTVTKFVADGTNIDVDIVGASTGTKTELGAWWANYITTEYGIENFWNAYTLEAANSIRQNTSYVDVVIENTQAGSFRFTDNDVRYYREDNSLPYDDTGSAIFMDYSGTPLVVEAETTFSESDRSKLFSIRVPRQP